MNKQFGNNSCTFTIGITTKQKKKYKTADDAILAAKNKNSLPETLHKYIAYKCDHCGSYHIGKTKKEINEGRIIK